MEVKKLNPNNGTGNLNKNQVLIFEFFIITPNNQRTKANPRYMNRCNSRQAIWKIISTLNRENTHIMLNRQVCFCFVNHISPLNVVIWENLSLEELLYAICICFITHKIAKQTSLTIDNAGIAMNNIR
ncbi:Uncharacterised protein [Streptococcus pneumoniae]|nr:Uncharacterised protein [Streptococcus pneumoniae]